MAVDSGEGLNYAEIINEHPQPPIGSWRRSSFSILLERTGAPALCFARLQGPSHIVTHEGGPKPRLHTKVWGPTEVTDVEGEVRVEEGPLVTVEVYEPFPADGGGNHNTLVELAQMAIARALAAEAD